MKNHHFFQKFEHFFVEKILKIINFGQILKHHQFLQKNEKSSILAKKFKNHQFLQKKSLIFAKISEHIEKSSILARV